MPKGAPVAREGVDVGDAVAVGAVLGDVVGHRPVGPAVAADHRLPYHLQVGPRGGPAQRPARTDRHQHDVVGQEVLGDQVALPSGATTGGYEETVAEYTRVVLWAEMRISL